MSTISCNEFLNQLESWMEGDRQPAAQAHVQSCVACQNLVSDMEAIRSTARTWETDEAVRAPRSNLGVATIAIGSRRSDS